MYWFSFRDRDSRDFGVRLTAVPQIQRAKERVTQVTIPGRAGTLTLTEGDESYEPYIQGIALAVPSQSLRSVLSWLRGDGWLTLSNDPDRRQEARVINAASFKGAGGHLEWYTVTVQFTCQPFKRELHPKTQTVTSGANIANMGDAPERPVFTLRGSGDMSITAGGNTLTLTGIEDGCIVDCDMMEVLTLDGGTIITGKSSGSFPFIPEGLSAVSFTGAASVSVTRAVRYL